MPKHQKTVLITGCSDGGLGAALAIELHKAGYRVFATARNVNKMAGLPQEIERLPIDVSSRTSIDECCQDVAKRTHGTLSMLINNAGVCESLKSCVRVVG
jgi:1-acylglycerone phosphate reductase